MYTNVERMGNNILLTEINESGQRQLRKIKYKPTLYTTFAHADREADARLQDGTPLYAKEFDSMSKAKAYFDEYKEVSGASVYGQDNFVWQFISDSYLDNIQPNFSNLRCHFIDIETTTNGGFPDVDKADEIVTMISLVDRQSGVVIVFTNGDPELGIDNKANVNKWVSTEKLSEYEEQVGRKLEVKVMVCKTEKDLFNTLVDFWTKFRPDIISGWNIELFDIPYIINRSKVLFGESFETVFSPWGIVEKSTVTLFNKQHTKYKIFGVSIIDYMDLYKKFTYSQQNSYKLDNIARVELGYGKARFEGLSFKETYEKFWDEFVDYNIIDSDLVYRLDLKLNLLELITTMAYESLINYEDVFSSLRTWDSLIYNHLRRKGIVIENKQYRGSSNKIAGAFVMEPVLGKLDWIMSFDLASLYPHLIKQYNISPETLVESMSFDYTVDGFLEKRYDLTALKEQNLTISARGNVFRRDEVGFLPEMMDMLYKQRKAVKKQMLGKLDDIERIKEELHRRGVDV